MLVTNYLFHYFPKQVINFMKSNDLILTPPLQTVVIIVVFSIINRAIVICRPVLSRRKKD